MQDGDASTCTPSVLAHRDLLYVFGLFPFFQKDIKTTESFLSLFTNSRKKTGISGKRRANRVGLVALSRENLNPSHTHRGQRSTDGSGEMMLIFISLLTLQCWE